MSKTVVLINAKREGYAVDQIYRTMTVGELIGFLQEFSEDLPVYLSHDGGYTYGGITDNDITDEYMNDENEEEEDCNG